MLSLSAAKNEIYILGEVFSLVSFWAIISKFCPNYGSTLNKDTDPSIGVTFPEGNAMKPTLKKGLA